jgi:hypothetical protein
MEDLFTCFTEFPPHARHLRSGYSASEMESWLSIPTQAFRMIAVTMAGMRFSLE